MATKPDAAKSEADAPVKKPVKSKKLLLIVGILFLVIALAGGGAWFFIAKKNAAENGGEETVRVAPKGPPTFLPLDNMVVNLADPGGEKVAQIGITLGRHSQMFILCRVCPAFAGDLFITQAGAQIMWRGCLSVAVLSLAST